MNRLIDAYVERVVVFSIYALLMFISTLLIGYGFSVLLALTLLLTNAATHSHPIKMLYDDIDHRVRNKYRKPPPDYPDTDKYE